jgi:alpha-L-fucosidase 2
VIRLRYRLFLLLASLFLLSPPARAGDANLTLWYTQPARTWMTQALPIGNGRLGGMIFGGVNQEDVQFNESTLWSGGPGAWAGYQGGNRPGGAAHIKEIQSLMAAGQIRQAEGLIRRYLFGDTRAFGAYQDFGDLLIDWAGSSGKPTDYRRQLDISRAVASVHYVLDGVAYDRTFFCSYPDQVMVLHFTCSQPGALHLILHLRSPHQGASITTHGNRLILQGKLPDNGLGYQAIALLRPEGKNAQWTAGADQIELQHADAATILLTAATGYRPDDPAYRGKDYQAANAKILAAVRDKSYADLLADHEKDYQALFGAVNLDLGQSPGEKLPTDQRLIAYHQGASDPALAALFFQFGRYLLISASRPGGLPSNRQGIWNDSDRPTWGADFPTMMNLEMMYWPAETTNLASCADPLIDMVSRLAAGPGKVTAKMTYGARGWVVNYTTNPWGFTAAGTSTYQYFPAGAAWLCQHLWEHYAFSLDRDYLARTAYPVMKSAAEFWVDHLLPDSDGTLVSSPSESPEHGGFAVGCTMDQEIVWDLFTHCIQASRILNVDDDFRAQLIQMRRQLSPLKIGRYGQLQEWKQDLDSPTDTHRHTSHLFALYPGDEISPLRTPALAAAAKKSLEFRGDGGPSWELAQKVALWARLDDGDHALRILHSLLAPNDQTDPHSKQTGTYANLFTGRPPLQVDANMAATAAIAEMLMQSQNGQIQLLPALPKAWAAGSVTGLRARGDFLVDEQWSGGALTGAAIHSLAGGDCRVRSAVPLTLAGALAGEVFRPEATVIEFPTTAGQTYRLKPQP